MNIEKLGMGLRMRLFASQHLNLLALYQIQDECIWPGTYSNLVVLLQCL